jgi:hypothetical protein
MHFFRFFIKNYGLASDHLPEFTGKIDCLQEAPA